MYLLEKEVVVDKGTIAWKVVRKRGRVSCVVTAPKYRLEYDKDSTVRAVEGTIGIMCFETRKQALRFGSLLDDTVLKVRGFGRKQFGWQLNWELTWLNHNLDDFYLEGMRSDVAPLVPGTILFDRVDVLT